MDSLADNALMQKVKEGDLDKTGLLFERYKKILFGFFFNIYHNHAISEDLVQTTFMRILKYRSGFRNDSEFKVWMFQIARNVSNDYFRKRKSHFTTDFELMREPEDGSQNFEQQQTHEDELNMLQLAMNRLTTDKREVLVLSKIDGLKYREIGNILNCSENTVKIKVFRALKSLKEEFEFVQSKV